MEPVFKTEIDILETLILCDILLLPELLTNHWQPGSDQLHEQGALYLNCEADSLVGQGLVKIVLFLVKLHLSLTWPPTVFMKE